jgi:general stress protein YciG
VVAPFQGKRVGGVELATDPDLIEEYGRRGELDIDDIYV